MSSSTDVNIYQQIWDADINEGNGLKAIAASSNEEVDINKGFIKIEESNITNGRNHTLFKEVSIPESKRETYRLCEELFDNYNLKNNEKETISSEEWREWSRFFFRTVVESAPMKLARAFAESQVGVFSDEQEWITAFEDLWIRPFELNMTTPSRNGFEHVFVGESKGSNLGGYHFWYKYWLDDGGDINGDRNIANDEIDFGRLQYDREGVDGELVPEVATIKYFWDPKNAPEMSKEIGGFFVGCSPEGLLALGIAAFYDKNRSNGTISNVTLNGNVYELKLFTDSRTGRGSAVNTFYPKLKVVNVKSEDTPTTTSGQSGVVISKALINAENNGRAGELGNETVTLTNFGDTAVDISNWKIAGNNGSEKKNYYLIGATTVLQPGQSRTFTLEANGNGIPSLRNSGGTIQLYNDSDEEVNIRTYESQSSREGESVGF